MAGDNTDAWMILESATFGTLSKMYKNLKSQLPERAAIANDFGLYLCNAVYPENQIKEKLLSLIDNNTTIPIYKYGFIGDWRKEPIWK